MQKYMPVNLIWTCFISKIRPLYKYEILRLLGSGSPPNDQLTLPLRKHLNTALKPTGTLLINGYSSVISSIPILTILLRIKQRKWAVQSKLWNKTTRHTFGYSATMTTNRVLAAIVYGWSKPHCDYETGKRSNFFLTLEFNIWRNWYAATTCGNWLF